MPLAAPASPLSAATAREDAARVPDNNVGSDVVLAYKVFDVEESGVASRPRAWCACNTTVETRTRLVSTRDLARSEARLMRARIRASLLQPWVR